MSLWVHEFIAWWVMDKFEKFENIEICHKALQLNKEVYLISEREELKKDFTLREQIRKSKIK